MRKLSVLTGFVQGAPKRRSLILAAAALIAALAAMSMGVVLSRNASKEQIVANLKARGSSSAGLLASFITQQATRESAAGERFLAAKRPSGEDLQLLATSFGSEGATLLDRSGRILDVAPEDRQLQGSQIASRYPHLQQTEAGAVAVSGVVRSLTGGRRVVTIAAPYPTAEGHRVLSVAYPVAGSVLSIFVGHASTLKTHQVLLVDTAGNIIASSPYTDAPTLAVDDRSLAHALAQQQAGDVTIAGTPSTYVSAAVPHTPWRLVMAAPNSKLFASINGAAEWLPWIVVALVALLALAVLSLLLRSQLERGRLATLSRELARAAGTDALTGLANRRALQERLAHASAHASRYRQSLSVLMIDLDHFKLVNDSYGHEAGDLLLIAVADTMREVFRESDIFGRWGGDEFLAVLPNTSRDGAVEAGERLCDGVAQIDVAHYELLERITLSVGCASALDAAPNDLINEADNSLFTAKREGRSRVSVGGVRGTGEHE